MSITHLGLPTETASIFTIEIFPMVALSIPNPKILALIRSLWRYDVW
jgi:hypothetical protein